MHRIVGEPGAARPARRDAGADPGVEVDAGSGSRRCGGAEVGLAQRGDRIGAALEPIGLGVEHHHPVTPAVADEDAFVGRIVGNGQGDLDRVGAHRPQLRRMEVRLSDHPAGLALANTVLRIELPNEDAVVVLVDRHEAMIDGVERDVPWIDVTSVDAVVRRSAGEIGVHLVVEMADHLGGGRDVAQVLRRDIPNHGAVTAGVPLGCDEQLPLRIDGACPEPRPYRLFRRDDRVIGSEAGLSENRDRPGVAQGLSGRDVVDGDPHVLDTRMRLGDEEAVGAQIVGQSTEGQLVEPAVRRVGGEIRLPHHLDGRGTRLQRFRAGIENQNPRIAAVGDEQPSVLGIVGDAARATELVGGHPRFPRLEARLPEHNRSVHTGVEGLRPDVEYQHPVVAAVAHEEPLVGVVHRDARAAGDVVSGQPDALAGRVGLPQHTDDRRPRLDSVGVNVEDHDLAADAGIAGAGAAVDDKEPLVDVVDGDRAGKLDLVLGPVSGGGTPRVGARLAEDVVGGGTGERAVVPELEYLDAAVAVAGYEQPAVDAIQRPLWRSPDAVAARAAVRDAADEGRVPHRSSWPSKSLAGWLFLCPRTVAGKSAPQTRSARPTRICLPCPMNNLLTLLLIAPSGSVSDRRRASRRAENKFVRP